MIMKKNIIGICESASKNSTNLSMLKWIVERGKSDFDFEIIDNLNELPHFRTEFTDNNVPKQGIEFPYKIEIGQRNQN